MPSSRQVAFLRAINIPGHPTIKKETLARAFEAAGCKDVRTYLQSGNVIFTPPARDFAPRVQSELESLSGGQAVTVYRALLRLERLLRTSPFAGAWAAPSTKL